MRARRIVVLAFVAAVVGCASSRTEGDEPRLDGRRWQLVELAGSAALGADTPRAAHLVFERDSARVGGATGCNHLGGQFARRADSLRFGQLITTKMACVDTLVMRQEATLLAALDSTRRHRVSGDTLTLLGSSGDVLARFVAAAP